MSVKDCDKHESFNAAETIERYEKMRQLYDTGFSDQDIAKAVGIAKYRVTAWRRNLKLKMNVGGNNDCK